MTFAVIQNFLLAQDESISEYTIAALREIGDDDSLLILRDLAKKEKRINIKMEINASILDVESRLGIHVPKSKVRRPILRANSPKVDRQ